MSIRTGFWAVAALALVASVPAWAKSGGHASSGHSGGSSGGSHGASPASGQAYHGASPVGSYRSGPSGGYYGGYRGGYRGGYGSGYGYVRSSYAYGYGYGVAYPYSYYHSGWGFGYYPYVYGAPLPPADAPPPPESTVMATVGASGQLVQGGGAVGLNLALEGRRLGFVADFNNLFIAAADGSGNYDSLRMLNAHLTYALISDPHGRLRLEAGVDSAFVPQGILIGPGVGVSAGVGLLGPIGLEGAVRLTPWPYQALDANAGLTLGLGPLGIRGGWRYTVLNDAAFTNVTQTFSGPYVGLALSI